MVPTISLSTQVRCSARGRFGVCVLANMVSRTENTPVPAIEEAFKKFVERDDIAILLINQYVCSILALAGYLRQPSNSLRDAQIADKIRAVISKFNEPMPAILEIPSKEHPYDPNKDYILQRVRGMLGSSS